MKKDTSWDQAAGWYRELLREEGTYQKDVILPNILRLLAPRRGQEILDLACGEGFFSRAFAKAGARVVGIDASKKLIAAARESQSAGIRYEIAQAHRLPFLKNQSFDAATIILAIQNIAEVYDVFAECGGLLAPNGRLLLVMNHPNFRIPQASSWGWDAGQGIQYRRIDGYLSESRVKIQIHPGSRPTDYTVSFHRPLQFYVKTLRKAGFLVNHLEEWISNRRSEPGPRAAAENRARKEIPLFLFIEAVKQ